MDRQPLKESAKVREMSAADDPVSRRFERYASADLASIAVRQARTEEDWQRVVELRRNGFDRRRDKGIEWVDASDLLGNCLTLLASEAGNEPAATLKIQGESGSGLELEQHVSLDFLIPEAKRPLVQFSRLSVSRGPDAVSTMFGMFKAAWRWSYVSGFESIVISTPPWAKAIYQFMAFHDYGEAGSFIHPLLPNVVHSVMSLPVQDAEVVWRKAKQPLCHQLFDQRHPSLEFWRQQ